MNDFKDKKVAVLGLGTEGISSALFLHKRGARVTVLDQKPEKELEPGFVIKIKNLGITLICGRNAFYNLSRFDIIVRSPGVRRNLPEIQKAEKKEVLITSQTKLFFDLCPCKIIGVTGTKGKGTTSSLIYEMLKKEGKDVYLGGNIGKSPVEFLDKLNPQSIVVLEMSSFQLLDLTKSPHIGVVLMITQEHLDYHQDVYEYVDAKRNILRFQVNSDFAVINRDYPASGESDTETKAKIFQVSREGEVMEGCFVRNGEIISNTKNQILKIIDTKDILLPGKHNLENICAAVCTATLMGVSKKNVVETLKTFKGLEHRLEFVAEINGVKYYDDSFSTTPETAVAAIQSFTAPEILILGGSSKNSDFTKLIKVIQDSKNIKAIIGIGTEWKQIKEGLMINDLRFMIIEGAKNMHQVIQAAAKIARPGDIVLLSPACASFDMFKNYKDRGEQFKNYVFELSSKIKSQNAK